MVQKLLDEGAEPNVKDYANWTPLVSRVLTLELFIGYCYWLLVQI